MQLQSYKKVFAKVKQNSNNRNLNTDLQKSIDSEK